MRVVTFAKIPVSEAPEAIPNFLKLELIDRSAKIAKEDAFRLVPVAEGREDRFIQMGYELTEGPAYTLERRSPQERIMEEMSDLPEDIRSALPMKWEYVGSIVVLKMDPKCDPYKERIGRVYAKILEVDTVCVDSHGVSGEFRRPSMEVIYGTGTESVRLENGIRYFFDVSKVMFASGNTDERYRMREQDCTGEIVVDMFAGIGYFTLPLAKYSGARRIFACEKNPDSYCFLVKNIEINDVGDIVIPILADNRALLGAHFADRILMGYVQRTSEFLPKALKMIKKGGIIHYHDTFYVHEYKEKIEEIFTRACGREGFRVEMVREVKSFAPSVSHYVADVRIL
ncbi:MAG: class I SAM-dependent methyltransferase family protein [Candidatus Methanomethylophilaceae archaeon]|jgi:tRNA wybutosine-synthesizing protein 2